MTKLYPIPVEGYGTRDVESLPSYIFRSAYEHGISVGQLLTWCTNYWNTALYPDDPIHKSKGTFNVAEVIGANKTAKNLVNVFSQLSGQDLTHSTLGILNNSTGRSANEIRKSTHWCPACLHEWHIQQVPAYFKLIWQLTAIEYCPIHNVRLIDQCYKCGSKQHSMKRKVLLDHCQDCGSPLWNTSIYNPTKAYERCGSWIHKSADLELLFEDIAYYGNQNISYENLRKSLDHLLDYYWKLDREQELFDVLPMNKLVCVIDGITMISLKVVRRFAAQMGISLYDLYTGNAHQTSAVLDFNEYCSLPPLLDFSRRESNNHDKIFQEILRVQRENIERPISLKQFAREVGVSVGYLEYRHPALSKKTTHEYLNYKKRQQEEMILQAKNATLSYLIEHRKNGDLVSRKQAYRDLKELTGLPKFKLKDAIKQAFSLVG